MKLKGILPVFLALQGVMLGVAWSEPERLVPYNTYNGLPTPIVANDGIAWNIILPWVLYFPDEQAGWQKVTECYLGGLISACFDKGDTLWLVRDNTGYGEIYYTRYDGEVWSEVDTVPVYPFENFNSRVAADSSGGVWVGWITMRFWNRQAAYNRYQDGEWGDPQTATDTLETMEHEFCSITTDALGRVWFGWLKHSPGEYLEARYCDGNSWSDVTTIEANEEEPYGLGLFTLSPDRKGGMWAIWSFRSANDSFQVRASHCDGEAWSEPDTIAEAGNLNDTAWPEADITVDSYGNAWVVWRQALEENDAYGDIYYSVNSGSGWSEPAPVNEHPAVDRFPDIAVDGAGRVWCVWGSTRDDSAGIWASYTTSSSTEETSYPVIRHPTLSVKPSVGGSFTFRVSSPDIRGELLIYDAGGRVVRHLTIRSSQVIRWDGTDEEGYPLSCGVYFVRVESGTSTPTGKVVLIR